jgi:alpha-beta hydrolase superfamily lysophospholipase
MRTPRFPWLAWLAGLIIAFLVLSFAGAAMLAEGALHPLLRRRASDTAILAHSIAQSTGATARKVSIRAGDDVALSAWWLVPARQNGRAVMVCHGVADSAYGALGFAPLFLKNGYQVLVPDSRGHGESLGFVTYGVLEAEDTVSWLRWTKGNQVSDVFGFGESLGGAILIQSLAHGADFRAIVAESSYSSFEAVADERVGRVVSAPLAFILVREGILYTSLRYGVNLANARPDAAIAHAHIPILLIHGTADNETSPAQSMELAKINPRIVNLWLVPGAKHTGAYATAPRAFERKVLQWFEQAIQSHTPASLMPADRPADRARTSFASAIWFGRRPEEDRLRCESSRRAIPPSVRCGAQRPRRRDSDFLARRDRKQDDKAHHFPACQSTASIHPSEPF